MTQTAHPRTDETREALSNGELARLIKAYFQAAEEVRRGICLLNAGQYDEAAGVFARAGGSGGGSKSLPSYLAACLLAQGNHHAAAGQFEKVMEVDPKHSAARIRHAFALW